MGFNFPFLSGYCAQPMAGGLTLPTVKMGSGAKLILDASTSLTDCPLQWDGDPDSGLSYGAANNWKLVANQTIRATLFGSGLAVVGTISGDGNITAGTAGLFGWSGDADTYLERNTADTIRHVVGGSAQLTVDTTNVSAAQLVASPIIAASVNLQGPVLYLSETTEPSALANYSILFSLDVGGKTQLTAKQGAAGTVVPLAIEV